MLVKVMKSRLPFADYSDVRGNLPEFIRFIFTRPFTPRFTWSEFVSVWARRRSVVHVTYDGLRGNTAEVLSRMVAELTGETMREEKAEQISQYHSFESARARSVEVGAGVERPFLREGAVGGWRRYFSADAEAELDERAGPAMRLLGIDAQAQ